MKYIRIVDEKRGIVQITTAGERWYAKPSSNPVTGLPDFQYVPSSTWIASMYPKGIGFYRWLAEKGWDEAEAIKTSAGARGSKVHKACEILEAQGNLSIDTQFKNEDTSVMEVLGPEELEAILSFARWHDDTRPQLIASEMTVWGEFYAGTLDRIYRINGQIYIVDLKTSKSIWEEMKLQVSSYSHAAIDYKSLGITDDEWAKRKLAILQVGYPLNKNKYKFTEIEDKMSLFRVAYQIWTNENQNGKPKEIEIPLTITIKKEEQDGRKSTEGLEQKEQQVSQAGKRGKPDGDVKKRKANR
jgi:hypothetical protein